MPIQLWSSWNFKLNPILAGGQNSLFLPGGGGKFIPPVLWDTRRPNLVRSSQNIQHIIILVSQVDYHHLWACMCTHACTLHKFVHAPFSAVNSISRIGDFEKMAVTPLKKLKTTWLSQLGQFFGWFWGGQFSSLFSFGAVFFQKMGFLDFQNFQN